MKDLLRELDFSKVRQERAAELMLWGPEADQAFGGVFFALPSGIPLRIIVGIGEGWDHVSVSSPSQIPSWTMMDWVKRQFFHKHETVMQLHVPDSDHISFAANCLHLWRPHNIEIPRPPAWMVGPSTGGDNGTTTGARR